jgi:hypothetical protein
VPVLLFHIYGEAVCDVRRDLYRNSPYDRASAVGGNTRGRCTMVSAGFTKCAQRKNMPMPYYHKRAGTAVQRRVWSVACDYARTARKLAVLRFGRLIASYLVRIGRRAYVTPTRLVRLTTSVLRFHVTSCLPCNLPSLRRASIRPLQPRGPSCRAWGARVFRSPATPISHHI